MRMCMGAHAHRCRFRPPSVASATTRSGRFGTLALVRRPRAEEILGEWGVRDVTPDSARERERLEKDRDLNPHVGKPIRRRLRNFKPEADTYVASLGGPRPYMQRLRQIEHDTEAHLERLAEAY